MLTRTMSLACPGRRDAARQMREGVDAMGRGRAKAKQTKVARELKYYSPDTDLRALERELHGNSDNQQRSVRDDRTWDEDDDDDAWGSRER